MLRSGVEGWKRGWVDVFHRHTSTRPHIQTPKRPKADWRSKPCYKIRHYLHSSLTTSPPLSTVHTCVVYSNGSPSKSATSAS